jgi:shikimate 5-dehydrogenase
MGLCPLRTIENMIHENIQYDQLYNSWYSNCRQYVQGNGRLILSGWAMFYIQTIISRQIFIFKKLS